MIIYHVSREEELPVGEMLQLENYQLNKMEIDLFPEGLSYHGRKVLTADWYESPLSTVDITKSIKKPSIHITEYTFELIRKLKFPNMPSRMTSLFALKSLDDLQYWPELTASEYSIFRLEVDEIPKEVDASFLKSGLSQIFIDNPYHSEDTQFSQAFLADKNWENAIQYWSGEFSNDPRPELLVSLPVKVLDKMEKFSLPVKKI